MKYAYRLLKDTTVWRKPTYTLEGSVFPVSDSEKVGMHKHKDQYSKYVTEFMFVFNTREEAERCLEYEKYAESLRNVPEKDRRALLMWDYQRIDKYTVLTKMPALTGMTPMRRTHARCNEHPAPRYIARLHAIADIIEKHAEQIRKECELIVQPEYVDTNKRKKQPYV